MLLLWSIICACAAPVLARNLQRIVVPSALLTQFSGHPVSIQATLELPASYDTHPQTAFPTIYVVPAFNEREPVPVHEIARWEDALQSIRLDCIVVFLSAAVPTGHHEFADSANNGPWGRALTTELIPAIDRYFRTKATEQTRFVTGHSSGGWSALWLQVNYPDIFGGEWSSSPDPVDFRDFTGPDLTRVPPQNFYYDAQGHDYELVRPDAGWTAAQTLRQYVRGEPQSGPESQFGSFDAVFSPRGTDGKPMRLFDRATGAIDPMVEQYWEDHYDIARILRDNWPALGPQLRGKLHVIVGTQDTFHLDGSVRRLQGELAQLGSDAEITFAPGYNHFSIQDWDGGLIHHIAGEIAAGTRKR